MAKIDAIEVPVRIVSPGGKEIDPAGVNHPSHYNMGAIEVIDAIEDWGLSFNLGNAVKYIARAEHKGTPLKDLKKALWYVNREIALLEKAGPG